MAVLPDCTNMMNYYYHRSNPILVITPVTALMRLKDILLIHGPQDFPITVRQLGSEPDHRPLLKEIQSSGENNIILDCAPEKILDVLRQAKEVKMLEDYQVVTLHDCLQLV